MKEKTLYLSGDGRCTGDADLEKALLAAEAPSDIVRRQESAVQALEKQEESALPGILMIAKSLCILVAVSMLAGLARGGASLRQANANAPWVFWLGGGALLAALSLWLVQLFLASRREKDPETREACRILEQTAEELRTLLSLPAETVKADVLSFSARKGKDGPEFLEAAENREVELFRQDEELRLYDGRRILALPLPGASLRVLSFGVPVSAVSWHKPGRPDSRKYRQYGVLTSNVGQIGLRFCCALEFCLDGRRVRLLFPAYELAPFAALTGIRAPELPAAASKKTDAAPGEEAPDKISPLFYWRVPREEAGFWLTPYADVAFRAKHPRIYGLLVVLIVLALLLPALAFVGLVGAFRQNAMENGWVILGFSGGVVAGIGLCNLIAAWIHQYLGHWFTLACWLAGGIMMLVSWFMI